MKIALIDDRESDLQRLEQYLQKYKEEHDMGLEVHTFLSSIEFLETYQNHFDIIFLDIEMPGEDGLSVAREIRQRDASVAILFVTNMIQYAICGYEVNAVDFMVKPVEYFNFTVKLEKAMNLVKKQKKQALLLGKGREIRRIQTSDIKYVEKDKNHLVFHTVEGILRERGSMAELKEHLKEQPFGECMAGCMVNFAYVDLIYKDDIYIGEEKIPVSRRMKKKFMQEYMEYAGDYV